MASFSSGIIVWVQLLHENWCMWLNWDIGTCDWYGWELVSVICLGMGTGVCGASVGK